MRIALITYEFPPETLGGIATYGRHATRMLVERGHEVVVFAGSPAGGDSVEHCGSVVVQRLHCTDRRKFSTHAIPALAAAHDRTPFDVAEIPDLYADGAGLRARIPDLPIVLRAHTPHYIPSEIDFRAIPTPVRLASAARRVLGGVAHREPWSQVWATAATRVKFTRLFDLERDHERLVALEADLVVPPSRRLADRLRTDWRIEASRIRVVRYPHFPAPDLLALAPSTSANTIAFHGSIRLFKGVHVLVRAFETILERHPQTRLVLAGSSGASPIADSSWAAWKADKMVRWSDTLQWLRPQLDRFGDRVVLRGFVPPGQLASHLAETDICVFPSLFDNFPSACLEAMSAGRAIVATRSGGMEEMLGNDEAGLLVPTNNPPALARAICRLIEALALRQRVASHARERLRALCDPAVIGPQMEAVYEEAIARRRSVSARPVTSHV